MVVVNTSILTLVAPPAWVMDSTLRHLSWDRPLSPGGRDETPRFKVGHGGAVPRIGLGRRGGQPPSTEKLSVSSTVSNVREHTVRGSRDGCSRVTRDTVASLHSRCWRGEGSTPLPSVCPRTVIRPSTVSTPGQDSPRW